MLISKQSTALSPGQLAFSAAHFDSLGYAARLLHSCNSKLSVPLMMFCKTLCLWPIIYWQSMIYGCGRWCTVVLEPGTHSTLHRLLHPIQACHCNRSGKPVCREHVKLAAFAARKSVPYFPWSLLRMWLSACLILELFRMLSFLQLAIGHSILKTHI